MDNLTRKKKYANTRKPYLVHHFPRNSGLIGLTNLGNTCYMNAALQALSNCPQLTRYMLQNFDLIKPGLAKNFAFLLYEIWVHSHYGEYSNQTNHKVFYDHVTPSSILHGIKTVCPNFRSAAQQDAQEFLREFLSEIHEELKIPVNNSLTNHEDHSRSNCDEEDNCLSNCDEEDNSLSNCDEEDNLKNSVSSNKNDELNDDDRLIVNHQNDKKVIPNKFDFKPVNLDQFINNFFNNLNDKSTNDSFKKPINSIDKSTIKSQNSANNLLSDEVNDDYVLNENDQITPGLGDVVNENINSSKCLNGTKEFDFSNENDQNFFNLIPNGEYANDHSLREMTDCFMREESECSEFNLFSYDFKGIMHTEEDSNENGLNENEVNENELSELKERELNDRELNDRELNDRELNDRELDDRELFEFQLKNYKQNKRYQLNDKRSTDDQSNEDEECTKQESSKKHKKSKIIYESIISKMFDGEILNSVQCLTCKNVSTIKETFQDLSLPIPNKEDLLQTRQANKYLKSLENSSYSSLKRSKQQIKEQSVENDKIKIKNGLTYLKLNSEDSELSHLDESSSKLNQPKFIYSTRLNRLERRLIKLPVIRYLFIILLYINYFFKAYILYFLLSIFYWSQSNLWGPTITLNDCLDAFFSSDELKDNNMYSCEKCKKLRNGIKYTNLVKSPDILCIHFKRFRNELMFPSKISTYVSFPLKGLNISNYMFENQNAKSYHLLKEHQNSTSCKILSKSEPQQSSEDSQLVDQQQINRTSSLDFNSNHLKQSKRKNEIYDLVSVICHRGHYNSGHYITYALNCLDQCWYEYDDKSVRKVDENKVLNCESYVLFYKRNLDVSTQLAEESDEEQLSLLNDDENEPLLKDEDNQKMNFLFRKNSSSSVVSLSQSEMFRKRKYYKINGELEYSNKFNDILGDLKL